MDKTKEEYVQFLRHAMEDRKSNEFIELYQFLLQCFIRADGNMDGMVTLDEFDQLLESATALPQEHGYAPQSKALYSTDAIRKEAHSKIFYAMDENGDGNISFEEWLAYALDHGIMGDVKQFPKNIFSDDVSKEEFIAYVQKAVDRNSSEFRQLFYFLLKCFTDADSDKDGAVQPSEFDRMIEIAAAAPRRHGIAPATNSLFKTEAERLKAREEYFTAMDENNDGNISLNEWVKFVFEHIQMKVANL